MAKFQKIKISSKSHEAFLNCRKYLNTKYVASPPRISSRQQRVRGAEDLRASSRLERQRHRKTKISTKYGIPLAQFSAWPVKIGSQISSHTLLFSHSASGVIKQLWKLGLTKLIGYWEERPGRQSQKSHLNSWKAGLLQTELCWWLQKAPLGVSRECNFSRSPSIVTAERDGCCVPYPKNASNILSVHGGKSNNSTAVLPVQVHKT